MRFLFTIVFLLITDSNYGSAERDWVTTDELEHHICPDDLKEFLKWGRRNLSEPTAIKSDEVIYAAVEDTSKLSVPDVVDCFGLGSLTKYLFLNMRPGSSDDINTHFYFSSRRNPIRNQVYPGAQFGLEWVDFKPDRKTIMIVHGFMSHSNASWVLDMTKAFLEWADVNVIAVDWSGGGNTWKYWRAVANTRRVGSDVTGFMKRLIEETGARVKDFHFVGHSLGAHIVSYVSYHIGRVARITGLDPAQPCFRTSNPVERLDETDADFVDVIHTNGRLLHKIGFGFPDPIGHADFYPNGGMKQPGCFNNTNSIWERLLPMSAARLQQAICSHGRAYLLYTESLINNNCSFRAHQWNLTYEGVNASLTAACSRLASCSVMGIKAIGDVRLPRANGPYLVLTTEKQPFCPTEDERRHPSPDLLRDLRQGFRLDRSSKVVSKATPAYADPDPVIETTTAKGWFWNLISKIHKKCEELIVDCHFNNDEFNCCEHFYTVDSEYVPCYSFNSLLGQYVHTEEYQFIVNRSTGPGILSFRLLGDAQKNDVSSSIWSLINIRMLHLPTMRYQKKLLRTNLDLVVTVGGIVGLFFNAEEFR